LKVRDDSSWIIIHNLNKIMDTKVSLSNFLDKISTDNGIILADNFCTQNWERLKDRDIYKMTGLSPGPFCFSEPEANVLDILINRFQPKKIILPYDVPLYKEYIANFSKYLDERKLTYILVQIDELKKRDL
jgi:hypothetical protein